MSVTILFGVIGLVFITLNYEINLPIFKVRRLVYYLAIFVASAFGGRFFIAKKIRGFYVSKIINFIKNLPKLVVFKTFIYSVIRYLIFSHQFYYLLVMFGVEIDYETLIKLIFAMYLLASIIPSLPMFDWLIKGSVAVFVFGLVGINELVIVSITTIMWILNFAFPAIIGSYFVLNFKYTFTKN